MKVKKVGQVINAVLGDKDRFPLTYTELKVFLTWLAHAPGFHPTTVQISKHLRIAQSHVSAALRSLAKKEVLWYEGRGATGQARYRIHDALAATAGEVTDVSWEDELEVYNARKKPLMVIS